MKGGLYAGSVIYGLAAPTHFECLALNTSAHSPDQTQFLSPFAYRPFEAFSARSNCGSARQQRQTVVSLPVYLYVLATARILSSL